MQFPIADANPADAIEEEKRNGALQPLNQIFLDLLLTATIGYLNRDAGSAEGIGRLLEPVRLGESLPKKTNGERRCEQLYAISEAEGALEPYTAEPDGVQGFLVRVSEAAKRRKVLLREVIAVVIEYESLIRNAHRRFRRASVISVLQELRKNVPGALNLLEELVPWTREFRVLLKLIPSLRGSPSD